MPGDIVHVKIVAGEVSYPVLPSESFVYILDIDEKTVLITSGYKGGEGGGNKALEIKLYIFLKSIEYLNKYPFISIRVVKKEVIRVVPSFWT